MSRQTDLEANANRTTAEDEELRILQAGYNGPRVLRAGDDGYVMGKTTYANDAVPPPGTPYPAPAQPQRMPDGPTEPVPPVQPQRPRADGSVPVHGDKDWVRYAGPDKF